MKPVRATPPEVLADKVTGEWRYRLVKAPLGFLVTSRSRDRFGLLTPTEWLHQNEEAALACFDAAVAMENAVVFQHTGCSELALTAAETANTRYAEVCLRLDDHPKIGWEARDLLQQEALPLVP